MPGLNDSDSDSDGSEETDKFQGSKGAMAGERLRKSMRTNASSFVKRIEENMSETLEEDRLTAFSAQKYASQVMAVGTQRTLGYMVWLLAHVHSAMFRGDHARARLLVLGGMMMAEQSCLDGNWKTAWKMMGIESPPWQAWTTMDVASVKRETAKSRLADPAWVATVIADLKDEDFLMKRRGNLNKGPWKEGEK